MNLADCLFRVPFLYFNYQQQLKPEEMNNKTPREVDPHVTFMSQGPPQTHHRSTSRPSTSVVKRSSPRKVAVDIVSTSEACSRIKKKVNSVAFVKSTKPSIGTRNVSPNMLMQTHTKTPKEIRLERRIKELFENEPLFRLTEIASGSGSSLTDEEKESIQESVGSFLVKNLRKMSSLAVNDNLKMLRDFNVPLHLYKRLPDEDSKERYLMDHVYQGLRSSINALEELREAHSLKDSQKIAEIEQKFKQDNGLYAWLNVETPHTALHKKLRKALIEKFQSEDITEEKCPGKIALGLFGETFSNSEKVLIDSTRALHSGGALMKSIEGTFDNFVSSCKATFDAEKQAGLSVSARRRNLVMSKATTQTLELINAKNIDKSKPMNNRARSRRNRRTLSRPGTAKNKDSEPFMGGFNPERPLSPQEKKLIRSTTHRKLNWNPLFEKKFGEHKAEMRIRLAELSSTNSWNQVVLGSFIKMFTKKPKPKEVNLFDYYRDLEYNKVKKVVSAIPSLNECIDKNYFQTMIDRMNKEKISQVETVISNRVIAQYEKEKAKSAQARFKFLKRKAEKKEEEIKQRDRMLQARADSEIRRQENFAMTKRLRTVLKGLDNNYTTLRSSISSSELDRYYRPKKRNYLAPLIMPVSQQTEAYRNATIYEFFRDYHEKPRSVNEPEFDVRATTGGPPKLLKEKTPTVHTQEQVTRAIVLIQKAFKRYKRRRVAMQERNQKLAREEEARELKKQQSKMRLDGIFFVTQSSFADKPLPWSTYKQKILIEPVSVQDQLKKAKYETEKPSEKKSNLEDAVK